MKHNIIIIFLLISGVFVTAYGIVTSNIFAFLLGLMYITEIFNILNEKMNEKIYKQQKELEILQNENFKLLFTYVKPYIKDNPQLITIIENYIEGIRILEHNNINKEKSK